MAEKDFLISLRSKIYLLALFMVPIIPIHIIFSTMFAPINFIYAFIKTLHIHWRIYGIMLFLLLSNFLFLLEMIKEQKEHVVFKIGKNAGIVFVICFVIYFGLDIIANGWYSLLLIVYMFYGMPFVVLFSVSNIIYAIGFFIYLKWVLVPHTKKSLK